MTKEYINLHVYQHLDNFPSVHTPHTLQIPPFMNVFCEYSGFLPQNTPNNLVIALQKLAWPCFGKCQAKGVFQAERQQECSALPCSREERNFFILCSREKHLNVWGSQAGWCCHLLARKGGSQGLRAKRDWGWGAGKWKAVSQGHGANQRTQKGSERNKTERQTWQKGEKRYLELPLEERRTKSYWERRDKNPNRKNLTQSQTN